MKRAVIAMVAVAASLGGLTACANSYGGGRDRDFDGIPNRADPNPNNPRNPGLRDRDRDGIPNAYDRRDNRRY